MTGGGEIGGYGKQRFQRRGCAPGCEARRAAHDRHEPGVGPSGLGVGEGEVPASRREEEGKRARPTTTTRKRCGLAQCLAERGRWARNPRRNLFYAGYGTRRKHPASSFIPRCKSPKREGAPRNGPRRRPRWREEHRLNRVSGPRRRFARERRTSGSPGAAIRVVMQGCLLIRPAL